MELEGAAVTCLLDGFGKRESGSCMLGLLVATGASGCGDFSFFFAVGAAQDIGLDSGLALISSKKTSCDFFCFMFNHDFVVVTSD